MVKAHAPQTSPVMICSRTKEAARQLLIGHCVTTRLLTRELDSDVEAASCSELQRGAGGETGSPGRVGLERLPSARRRLAWLQLGRARCLVRTSWCREAGSLFFCNIPVVALPDINPSRDQRFVCHEVPTLSASAASLSVAWAGGGEPLRSTPHRPAPSSLPNGTISERHSFIFGNDLFQIVKVFPSPGPVCGQARLPPILGAGSSG